MLDGLTVIDMHGILSIHLLTCVSPWKINIILVPTTRAVTISSHVQLPIAKTGRR